MFLTASTDSQVAQTGHRQKRVIKHFRMQKVIKKKYFIFLTKDPGIV